MFINLFRDGNTCLGLDITLFRLRQLDVQQGRGKRKEYVLEEDIEPKGTETRGGPTLSPMQAYACTELLSAINFKMRHGERRGMDFKGCKRREWKCRVMVFSFLSLSFVFQSHINF